MLPTISQDKALHVVYGSALASLGALHSPEAGLILCVAFAVGKEVYDRISELGNHEVADALATLVGGALVLLPWVLS